MTNTQRQQLLEQLADMVDVDHPDCEGLSVFCPGCVAVRSVDALMEVYHDHESPASNPHPTYSLSGVPPLLPPEMTTAKAADITIGELDDIAERIIRERNGGEPDIENITIN